MTTSAPLIELSGIERVFFLGDSEVHALHQLDLAIAAGEYAAVMGPSGSGKSTLLNLLGLLDRPNAGTYRLEGRDVTTLTPEEQARVRRERIGFVFQSFHLVPRLTAAENIALPMVLAGIAPAERKARVEQALDDYGLTNRADHRPNQLSGGQRLSSLSGQQRQVGEGAAAPLRLRAWLQETTRQGHRPVLGHHLPVSATGDQGQQANARPGMQQTHRPARAGATHTCNSWATNDSRHSAHNVNHVPGKVDCCVPGERHATGIQHARSCKYSAKTYRPGWAGRQGAPV